MRILQKDIIAQNQDTKISRFIIQAPLVASMAKPGQFVVVMTSEKGERIPLTVVDKDEYGGTISLIVQEIGYSTRLLGELEIGDSLYAVVGPLGHATQIKNYGRVIVIGGGVGIAEIYPVTKALKEKDNHITTILGARTKALLILEDELRSVSDELYITTDDGSYGRKGFVTDILKELLSKSSAGSTIDLVYAVGPIPMMKLVSNIGNEFKVKTMVSLNALMIDATGMCGGCRVKIGNEVKFSCVDGPEFEGSLVDWGELLKRTKAYLEKENHICKLKNI